MDAVSATCFVHATTSSFHASLRWREPFAKSSVAGAAVMPTSGTFWM